MKNTFNSPLNHQFDMKLSHYLLISCMLLLIGSTIANNYLFKKKYDFLKKNNETGEFVTIFKDQFFKHIKFDGTNILQSIEVQKDSFFAVKLITRSGYQFSFENMIDGAVKPYVSNDTLIIAVKAAFRGLQPEGMAMMKIYAKNLESVECIDAQVRVYNIDSPYFTSILRGQSLMRINNFDIQNLNVFVGDNCTFDLQNHNSSINNLNVKMEGNAKLTLPELKIEKFNLTADSNAVFEMPLSTWRQLGVK